MSRRRNINADPEGHGRLRAIGWFLDDRVLWPLEERLLWPLQDLAAERGLDERRLGAGALAAVAACAAVFGAVALTGGDEAVEPLSAPAPVAATAPAPAPPPPAAAEKPSGPALRGAPPSFESDERVRLAAKTGEVLSADGPTAESSGADGAAEGSGAGDGAGATASKRRPVPAGPVAMKVARRFSEAFVHYEVGERPGRAKVVFEETATPRLASALAERPPRQPESAEVPKARVVNLVAGPRRGRAYTVSASLLRVGTTSELRLVLRKRQGTWRVTDVRG